jgi:hypothetical protein
MYKPKNRPLNKKISTLISQGGSKNLNLNWRQNCKLELRFFLLYNYFTIYYTRCINLKENL